MERIKLELGNKAKVLEKKQMKLCSQFPISLSKLHMMYIN